MEQDKAKDPTSTDDDTEWNQKCRKCVNALFLRDKAGRKIYKIGKCNAKDKYIVADKSFGTYDCDEFKSEKSR